MHGSSARRSTVASATSSPAGSVASISARSSSGGHPRLHPTPATNLKAPGTFIFAPRSRSPGSPRRGGGRRPAASRGWPGASSRSPRSSCDRRSIVGAMRSIRASVTTTARRARGRRVEDRRRRSAAADEDGVGLAEIAQRVGRGAERRWDAARRARRRCGSLRAIASGSWSIAMTAAPRRAHSIATAPLPQPTSQMRSPVPGPSAASASARTSALVIIPARCSNASSGSAQRVGVRGGQTVARPAVGSCTITTLGSLNGGSVARRSSRRAERLGDDGVARPRGRRRSLGCCRAAVRIATFGWRSAALIAACGSRPWAETTSASSHGTPSRAKATRDRGRRGVHVEVVGQRRQRADDAEEAGVARREHARRRSAEAAQRRVEVRAEHDVLLAPARVAASTARPPATTLAAVEQMLGPGRHGAAGDSENVDLRHVSCTCSARRGAGSGGRSAGRRRATGRRRRRRRARGRRARAPAS